MINSLSGLMEMAFGIGVYRFMNWSNPCVKLEFTNSVKEQSKKNMFQKLTTDAE